MFDRFISRLTLRGSIIAETGLHIGTGAMLLDPSATDSPVIRDAAGRPFIPGSSFKGALRSHLEKLLRGVNSPKLRLPCDPLVDPCLPEKSGSNKEGLADLKKRLKKEATGKDGIDEVKYNDSLTESIKKLSCPACLLFGSNALAARVMIKDLFVDPQWWVGRYELRDGVGIDRDTETARHGIKYDFEVVPATTRFELEIIAENCDVESYGLLAIALRELENGRVAIGGKTTRGLGHIRFEVEELEIVGDHKAKDLPGEGSTDLLEYLSTGKGRRFKKTEAEKYLSVKLEDFRKDILGLPPLDKE